MMRFDAGYGDRDLYVPWFVEIERPDESTFVMNATHTYRINNIATAERPADYRQDFGPNRRSPSGAVG